MEKIFLIFSALIHNDEFMYLFWGGLGIINMVIAPFLLKSKHLTEKELQEISPDFKHIVYDYTVFSVFTLSLVIVLTWIVVSSFNDWALAQYGRKFYPSLVFFFSGYGIYQALFALSKGVYPMGRILVFIYDDVKQIQRVARLHIIFSIMLFVISALVFFATV